MLLGLVPIILQPANPALASFCNPSTLPLPLCKNATGLHAQLTLRLCKDGFAGGQGFAGWADAALFPPLMADSGGSGGVGKYPSPHRQVQIGQVRQEQQIAGAEHMEVAQRTNLLWRRGEVDGLMKRAAFSAQLSTMYSFLFEDMLKC